MKIGKYELVRKLAVGGMAEVFLAKLEGARGFEKRLVVKRLLPHLAESPEYSDLFLAEAQLAAQLNHPNLVHIFDFGETGGTFFIAMEYVDGADLRCLIRHAAQTQQPLALAACIRIACEGCDALSYVHDFIDPKTGQPLLLIHRDISPENILVSRSGTVKVVDFGIAKQALVKGKTKTGLVRGKLSYMPPEQLRAKPLDRRVDVYALGATLFELASGGAPYDQETEAATMSAVLDEPVPYVRLKRQDIPGDFQDIFEKALAKDAQERFASCAELKEALLAFQRDQNLAPATTAQLAAIVNAAAPMSPAPAAGAIEPEIARRGPTSDPAKSHQFSSKWEAPGYGLDVEGKLHGAEHLGRAPKEPLVFEPFQPTRPQAEEKLEFARELGKPRANSYEPPPPLASRPSRPRARPLRAGGIAFIVLLGVAGYWVFTHPSEVRKEVQSLLQPPNPSSDRAFLVVDSQPPGASVLINGKPVGETPWAGENVYAHGKRQELTVTKRGFREWKGSFSGGVKADVHAQLEHR